MAARARRFFLLGLAAWALFALASAATMPRSIFIYGAAAQLPIMLLTYARGAPLGLGSFAADLIVWGLWPALFWAGLAACVGAAMGPTRRPPAQ